MMKKVKLGNEIQLQRGYDLTKKQMHKGDIPVVGSNGIIGYHNIAKGVRPCVTIGRSGSVGKVHFYNHDVWVHNTALYIKDFNGNNPKFIYYFLKNLRLDNMYNNQSSVVPTLDRKNIHALELPFISDITRQNRIVEILSKIDRKIELNRQINHNLPLLVRSSKEVEVRRAA